MLKLVFFLLKILGYVLLFVILCILAAAALVLFAPIKYKITAKRTEEEQCCEGKLTYLSPLFRLSFAYPKEQALTVRFLWFVVYPRKKKRRNKRKRERTSSWSEPSESCQSAVKHTTAPALELEQEKPDKKKETVSVPRDHIPKNTEQAQKEVSGQQIKERKQKDTVTIISQYTALLREHEKLILEVLNTVLKALKTTLPKRCRIELVFGTGQPDTTGFLYAAFCSMSGYLAGDVTVVPVWTEKCLSGTCDLKGKIRLVHLLAAFIKIKRDQNVKLLYCKLRSVTYGSKQ